MSPAVRVGLSWTCACGAVDNGTREFLRHGDSGCAVAVELRERWCCRRCLSFLDEDSDRCPWCQFPLKEEAPRTRESDPVNNPSHYKSGGMEAIDVIEAFKLGFRLGNCVKYILRAGKKGNRLEDLKKARWYLEREISKETK